MSPDPTEPDCLLLLTILARERPAVESALEELREHWPGLRLSDQRFPFDETDYYEGEMGSPLYRWWACRETLSNPADLVDWKQTCTDIEATFADENDNRTVNLDPGYLNFGLVVLGSHKPHHQKIYLGEGVYADPVLEYVDGNYRPFHWSFPDFQDDRYYATLETYRNQYKALLNQ